MNDAREKFERDVWFHEHLGKCQTCEYYYKGFCNLHEENIECLGECYDYSVNAFIVNKGEEKV